MKKLIYFLLVSMVIGVIFSLIFASLPVFPISTKAFFTAVERGQEEEAYMMLSPEFQQRLSHQQFSAAMKESGLDQYKEIVITNQDVDKQAGYASIQGVITTKQGAQIPIKIDFIIVSESSWLEKGWRIDSLNAGKPTSIEGNVGKGTE